jgi:hypothetical protein
MAGLKKLDTLSRSKKKDFDVSNNLTNKMTNGIHTNPRRIKKRRETGFKVELTSYSLSS